MKMSRLLEITLLLLEKDSLTAGQLSKRFGVSVRTIYRDIDDLSYAGVPVYCTRGAGGGISLLENYTLSRTMVTERERDGILFALQTLRCIRYPEAEQLLSKLGALFRESTGDWIEADLTPWGTPPAEADKFDILKSALLSRTVLRFDYINTRSERSARHMQPLKLSFKGQAWYLQGWDLDKNDYRMFRISRIRGVQMTDEHFDREQIPKSEPQTSLSASDTRPLVRLELYFAETTLYRLYDNFEETSIRAHPGGGYLVTVVFPEDEWVYGYLLSFGPAVKILSPPHIREIIKQRAEKTFQQYL